jgi:glycine/D-amino acid oxidase-like deaminating enzyme
MALQAAFQRLGGTFLCGEPVQAIDPAPGRFSVRTGARKVAAPRIVLAAGNAMGSLASQIGLHIPQRPQRGQLLVTERIRPLLPIPAVPIRQTAEGSVLIGSSQEEVGFDTGTTTEVAGRMAARAVRILPALADAVIVRQWAGLRVMTPDGCPIYVESEAWPGAFAALCHSGVTLAAAHAHDVAAAIAAGTLPQTLKPFHPGRFDVPQAA